MRNCPFKSELYKMSFVGRKVEVDEVVEVVEVVDRVKVVGIVEVVEVGW